MRAVTWHGRHDVRVDTVPDPEIVNPRDAIIQITSTAICGSDLHLYDGYIPGMRAGDILGHEKMGEVVEVGREMDAEEGPARRRPVHDQVRQCFFCRSNNSPPATTAIRPRPRTRPRSPTATRWAALSVTPTSPAAMPAARRNISACPIQRRRPDGHSRRAGGRQGAVPLRHPADRLDGGGKLPTSSRATPSRYGAAARSGCSRFSRPSCSAPTASSRSTIIRAG